MKKTTVPLSEPIKGHAGDIRQVVLREPTGSEYIELGEPYVIARNKDGTMYSVENDQVIATYLERCVVEPDALLLKQMGLKDGMAVKAALLDFFHGARAAT